LYRGEVPPDLVESLRQLEVRMRGLARRVTEEHPQYVEIRSEIEAVREQIAEEMRRRPVEDMGVLEQRRRMLEATEEFLGALIQARNEELTRVEAHRGRIERAETRMREAEQRLDGVRAKRREVEASEPAEEMVDVVSAARAGKAAGLEARTVAMMVVIAIVVGVALGFVVEYLSDVIRSSVDVKTYTGWEVVGAVPRQREGEASLLRAAEQSALWEAYNKIAVYLEEGLREMGKKVVGVSSVLVREGKTTVAVNAGVALARSGRKVLVVDGDMRRGTLHEQAGVESEPGWAEVLSGEKEVEEVVRPGPVDGMGVVPRGRRPANALMLLSSQRLREVLARLEEQRVWDVVIVDLPPMLGLVDAVWVGGRGVPLVMVMREGMVRRSQAAHVKGELGRLKAKVLGVVLNAVRETESEYYYYYYYHRYQSK
jgi:capsular exopolysaccharide synthesis family protein